MFPLMFWALVLKKLADGIKGGAEGVKNAGVPYDQREKDEDEDDMLGGGGNLLGMLGNLFGKR